MKKTLFVITKILLVVVILFTVAVGFLAYKADGILKKEVYSLLESKVNKNNQSIYQIDLDQIRTKIWIGDIELRGIQIRPKPELLDSIIPIKSGLLNVKVKAIKLKGARWYNVLFEEKTIITNKIIIDSPDISYYVNKKGKKNTSHNDFDLENVISENNIDLHFEEIKLKHTNFTLYDVVNDSSKNITLKNFSFDISNLSLNEETVRKSKYLCLFEDFTTGSGQIQFHLKNNYNLTIEDFYYNYNEDSLKVENLSFQHQLTKEGYEKSFKDDTPYYNISVRQTAIPLHSLDIFEKKFNFPLIKISDLNVFVFQSKKKDIRTPKRKPLLNEIFNKIPIPLKVDKIDLSNCNFIYEFSEANEIEKNALVTFNKTDVSIKNFTTIDSFKKESKYLIVDAKTSFMDKSPLTLNLKYDLTSTNEAHQVKAKLTNFALPNLNNTIAAIAPINIKNGIAHSATVNYIADNQKATGTLDLHYTDVWVELVKNEEKKKSFGIISFIGNSIIKKNNIPGSDKYKQGKIDYEFNPYKSILNYMWNATKTGLISSVSRNKNK